MPKVVITYDPDSETLSVEHHKAGVEYNPEYQAIMDMKASHFLNMQRNLTRVFNDQKTLMKFFIESQTRGRQFREQ